VCVRAHVCIICVLYVLYASCLYASDTTQFRTHIDGNVCVLHMQGHVFICTLFIDIMKTNHSSSKSTNVGKYT
jgi:hypothetical protein